MEFAIPLVTLWIVQLLAVISPGQSFVVISKLALASGRPAALAATLGMGLGSIIWAATAVAGLALLLEQAAWAYSLFKIAGGIYLIFLALMLWRHAPQAIAVEAEAERKTGLASAFGIGLLTQLANPKVIVFFGSIFAALFPADAPLWVFAVSLAIVFINETGWFALVALAFSARRSRETYLRAKTWLDRTMAAFLGLIGARLIADA